MNKKNIITLSLVLLMSSVITANDEDLQRVGSVSPEAGITLGDKIKEWIKSFRSAPEDACDVAEEIIEEGAMGAEEIIEEVKEIAKPSFCERLKALQLCAATSFLKEHKLETAVVACVLGGTIYYVYKKRHALFAKSDEQ